MIDPKKTLGEIATEVPKSMRVFERHGIDYSCSGQRTLVGVCTEHDIPVDRLVAEIESASSPSLRMRAVTYDDLAELIDHIVSTHHTFTRTELGRLLPLAERVRREQGTRHAELDRIRQLLLTLAADLGPHMDNEERVLFPYCVALEEAAEAKAGPPRALFGRVSRPVGDMRHDHEVVAAALRELRALTLGYTPPEDATEPLRELYQGLAAFERDLHEHIHLENNVVFPAAERIEQSLLTR
jgi:regulator of cell morphogenesis and NO signaling